MNKLFIFFVTITPFFSFAQKQTVKPFSFQALEQKEMDLPQSLSKIEVSQYIDDIAVIDARFDTSSIGFYNKDYFVLKNRTVDAISDNLKQTLATTAGNTGNNLVILIKKLWIGTQLKSKNIRIDLSSDTDN